jgi:ribonucleotide monophosphatase NagD (HAD superfamily)
VYDTALLDLDGVVYAGGGAIAHAVESLASARGGGMHLAYVTNNASRTPQVVAEHLMQIGVPAEPSDVITSAQAVARLIAEQVPTGSRVLVIGGEGLLAALRERGLEPVESVDDDLGAHHRGLLRGGAGTAVVRLQPGPDDPERARLLPRQRRGSGDRPDGHRR